MMESPVIEGGGRNSGTGGPVGLAIGDLVTYTGDPLTWH